MTLNNKTRQIMVLAIIIVGVATLPGEAAAAGPFQQEDCPDATSLPLNETADTDDYLSCKKGNINAWVKNQLYSNIEQFRGYESYLRNEGQKLTRSDFGIIQETGQFLISQAERIDQRTDAAERDLRSR